MNEETNFVNMQTIGKVFGKTSHQVGRELTDFGYRGPDRRPTTKALGTDMAVIRRDQDHPQWVSVLWSKAKVCQLLEDFGWRKVLDDGGTE